MVVLASVFSISVCVYSEYCYRSSHQRCSIGNMFLDISQNSQENTCARVSRPTILLKKRLWHRCFPVNFVKFLRTSFLQNTSGRLFLLLQNIFSTDTRSFYISITFFNSASVLLNFFMN